MKIRCCVVAGSAGLGAFLVQEHGSFDDANGGFSFDDSIRQRKLDC